MELIQSLVSPGRPRQAESSDRTADHHGRPDVSRDESTGRPNRRRTTDIGYRDEDPAMRHQRSKVIVSFSAVAVED